MTTARRYDAILFDVGHTLLEFVRPFEELWSEALGRRGLRVSASDVVAAFRSQTSAVLGPEPDVANLDFDSYRSAWLPIASATVKALGFAGDADEAAAAMWHALVVEKVRPYPDVRRTLDALVVRGYALGVVANWNVTLEYALRAHGIAQYFDAIVPSAIAGVEKPDPAIFRHALDLLGVRPQRALMVGDGYESDVVGARNAGINVVLLDRSAAERTADVIRGLDDLREV